MACLVTLEERGDINMDCNQQKFVHHGLQSGLQLPWLFRHGMPECQVQWRFPDDYLSLIKGVYIFCRIVRLKSP